MAGPSFHGPCGHSVGPCPRARTVSFGLASLLAACVALTTASSTVPQLSAADRKDGLPSIVFVSRALADASGAQPVAVHRASAGRLLLWESENYGAIRALVDAKQPGAAVGTPIDVLDPDVSYDGTRIVFSGYSREESSWRIYEIGVDGTGLRQITTSDRHIDLARFGSAAPLFENYDDLDPCYMPDGRICFVSTRHPGTAPDARVRSTNLYVVNADGSNGHRITSERFAADTPAVDPVSGQIVYSRWWRSARPAATANQPANGAAAPQAQAAPPAQPGDVPPGSPGYGQAAKRREPPPQPIPPDPSRQPTFPETVLLGITDREFPGVNTWFLAGINPDGTGMAMFSGAGLNRSGTQAYRPAFDPGGSVLALFIPQTPLHGMPGSNGLRRFQQGAHEAEMVAGVQFFPGQEVPANVLPEFTTQFRFVYESAVVLPDGRILVSATRPGALDYDIFIVDAIQGAQSLHQSLLAFSGTAEMHAVPIIPRTTPPVIADKVYRQLSDDVPRTLAEAYAMNGFFTFRVENIFANGPLSVPIPNAPPLGEALTIEFFTNFQRTSTNSADPPILIRRVDIGADGKVEVQLPAGVPLFEVLRRGDGRIPASRDGQIFHVGGFNFNQSGQIARCVGCHAGHSMVKVPRETSLANLAGSALIKASSARSIEKERMRPESLIDHRTDPIVSEWAAHEEASEAELVLNWLIPIRGRKVLLHRPLQGEGEHGTRSAQVMALSVATFASGKPPFHDRKEHRETRTVRLDSPNPVFEIPLSDGLAFDELRITILASDSIGLYEGLPGIALSEIEVYAQPASDLGAMLNFTRGDANGDQRVDLSDSVAILGALFQGQGPLVCDAAADADGDRTADVSDPVFLLNHLFAGGPPLPAPFPDCGEAPERGLGCSPATCD